jgi:hypothetical protein
MMAIGNNGYPEYKPTSKYSVVLLAGNTGNK